MDYIDPITFQPMRDGVSIQNEMDIKAYKLIVNDSDNIRILKNGEFIETKDGDIFKVPCAGFIRIIKE